jgi:hypothetical protein
MQWRNLSVPVHQCRLRILLHLLLERSNLLIVDSHVYLSPNKCQLRRQWQLHVVRHEQRTAVHKRQLPMRFGHVRAGVPLSRMGFRIWERKRLVCR